MTIKNKRKKPMPLWDALKMTIGVYAYSKSKWKTRFYFKSFNN